MSEQKPVLVILTPAFPQHENDGNWVHSQQLFVKKTRKLFPELDIIVLSFIYPYAEAVYPWNGATVISFNGSSQRKLKRLLLWQRIWKQLQQIRKNRQIAGMLSFWCGECALAGSYFAKKYAINHKIWICGQDARKKNKWVTFIRPGEEELVAMSDFLSDEFFKNHGRRPAHLVLNGIDVSLFSNGQKERNTDICGAGSLSVLKRYDMFVEIVKITREQIPAVKAVLCGDGEDASRVRQLVKNYSLQQNLLVTGMLTPREVIQHMQRSRIFLHPSSYEGFSTSCLEALYAGAHVISFVKPMHDEIKNWHIVKTKDEMIQKTLTLLQDAGLGFEPVLVSNMENSVKAMMQLFGIAPGRVQL